MQLHEYYSPFTLRVIKVLRNEAFTGIHETTSHKTANVWNFKCHAKNVFGKFFFLCATPLFCFYPMFPCSKYLLLNISFIICIKKYKKIISLCTWSNIGTVTYLSGTRHGPSTEHTNIQWNLHPYSCQYLCMTHEQCLQVTWIFILNLLSN